MSTAKFARFSGVRLKDDKTQALDEDVINSVATFASCRDLCTLGCVSRRFAPLPTSDSLWQLRALDILPSLPRVHSAMAELHLTSYRQLVEAFTRIGIPGGVLGFWKAETQVRSWAAQLEFSSRLVSPGLQGLTAEEVEARGELLRISLVAGGFLCESIAPNGTRHCVFTIRVSTTMNQRVKVGFFSMESESSSTMGGDGWVPGRSMAEAMLEYKVAVPSATARTPLRASGNDSFVFTRDCGRICRFTKLAAPFPPSSPTPSQASTPQRRHAATAKAAEGLCGLWCAPYGSHGLEIIQLSLDPSCATGCASLVSESTSAGRVAEVIAMTEEKPRDGSSTASSSSDRTSSSDSVCTSAPATDSSENGFGGLESDDSSAEDEDDEEGHVFSDDGVTSGYRCSLGDTGDCGCNSKDDVNYDAGSAASASYAAECSSAQQQRRHPSQLFGVKVTGDANVPAGKTSFAVDLEKDCDIDEELEMDTRPVVLFLQSGAVMANLANRRGQISFWRKGRGQINRVPGRWSPEWVDVDFVAYQAGSRCAFSVVFRQPTQAVRVIMDFERALGSKEEWPQWPTPTAV